MTHLLEKETPFVFSDECKQAFNDLRKKLIESPILVVPNWDYDFEIMCDASDFALGAVLRSWYDHRLSTPYHAQDGVVQDELDAALWLSEPLQNDQSDVLLIGFPDFVKDHGSKLWKKKAMSTISIDVSPIFTSHKGGNISYPVFIELTSILLA
ncbi:reverse transcriptase domain-containing protein [Tanacetum coccineum]